MADKKINEYLDSSLDSIGRITDMNTIIGTPINTPSGVTVIPVSRVAFGFASGVFDCSGKKFNNLQNSGGGGTGILITPLAFLTVGPGGDVKLISLNDTTEKIDRTLDIIENIPTIIERIKKSLV